MYHPRLYGSHFEMGFKYGTLLFEKAQFKLPNISPCKHTFGLQSLSILEDFYPEVIEEIHGFAKGIKETPKAVAAFLLSLGLFEPTTGQCSVFAFKNPDDSVVIGRNYDMNLAFKKYTESSLIASTHGFAFIGQSDVFIGRTDGINEYGLFIAMAFVDGTTIQPGIGFHFMIRKVLESCSTTQEAIALIRGAAVASATNYLIADTAGHIAVVESAPESSAIRTLQSGSSALYITNQFITPTMQHYDKGRVSWSKSSERYQGLERHLAKANKLDLNTAKMILSDPCVCLHLKQKNFGTLWSVVAHLNSLTIERAESKPRITNFKPDTRLSWWLERSKNK